MERFDEAVNVLRASHSHRSWWPGLEAVFAALRADVMSIRAELLDTQADHDDRLHQIEQDEEC